MEKRKEQDNSQEDETRTRCFTTTKNINNEKASREKKTKKGR